jgi:hypothetical protein
MARTFWKQGTMQLPLSSSENLLLICGSHDTFTFKLVFERGILRCCGRFSRTARWTAPMQAKIVRVDRNSTTSQSPCAPLRRCIRHVRWLATRFIDN